MASENSGVLDEELKASFFQGMSFATATVNVVTTDGAAGRAGVTVSAMSSVSADTEKPTLLVCINEQSAAAKTILENGVFCVNVLRDNQAYISDTFAGRYKTRYQDKFECAEWSKGATGSPRVLDAMVAFDCKIVATKQVGTHHVCFGEVQEITQGRQGSALVYANRAYGTMQRIKDIAMEDVGDEKALRIGCFHTFAPFIIPRLVSNMLKAQPNLNWSLVEGDERQLNAALSSGEIDAAIMFDFDIGDNIETELLAEFRPYVLMSKKSDLSVKAEILPSDLAGKDMISVSHEASSQFLEGYLKSSGIETNVVFRSSSLEMVRGLVGHDLGFALLMTKPATGLTYDGMPLISRALVTGEPGGRVVFAQRRDEKLPKVCQAFQGLVVELFSG